MTEPRRMQEKMNSEWNEKKREGGEDERHGRQVRSVSGSRKSKNNLLCLINLQYD